MSDTVKVAGFYTADGLRHNALFDGCLYYRVRSNVNFSVSVIGGGCEETAIPHDIVFMGRTYVVSHVERLTFSDVESIVFYASLCRIGAGAMAHCIRLQEIDFEGTTVRIGSNAFEGCTALKKVGLPPPLQSIERGAFEGCTALEELTLPESLRTIGNRAFHKCTMLREIHFGSGLEKGLGKGLECGLESIDDYAFCGSGLRRIVLPEGLQTVGESAFLNCEQLSEVRVPASVKKIGADAFGDRYAKSHPQAIYFGHQNADDVELGRGAYADTLCYVPKGHAADFAQWRNVFMDIREY